MKSNEVKHIVLRVHDRMNAALLGKWDRACF